MKKGLVICGPDVAYGPLALLSGTFEEKVQKAAALGCDGIELMVRDPAQLDWSAIKATLASAGLAVSQVVTGELYGSDGLTLVTADLDLSRRTEARLQSVIDLAARLGAMVNIGRVRGRLSLLGPVEDPWAVAVERFAGMARYAGERGVRINIEPINRYETDFILTAEEGLRLVHQLSSPHVGLMLDTFHMNIEEDSMPAALATAGDRLWHVHVADSNRRYPGSGHLDFAGVFAALHAMDYQGFVSAELLPQPDPDTAGYQTINYLRRFI